VYASFFMGMCDGLMMINIREAHPKRGMALIRNTEVICTTYMLDPLHLTKFKW